MCILFSSIILLTLSISNSLCLSANDEYTSKCSLSRIHLNVWKKTWNCVSFFSAGDTQK